MRDGRRAGVLPCCPRLAVVSPNWMIMMDGTGRRQISALSRGRAASCELGPSTFFCSMRLVSAPESLEGIEAVYLHRARLVACRWMGGGRGGKWCQQCQECG